MNIRKLVATLVVEAMGKRSYVPDVSDEALEHELYTAQGEVQQTVGPNDEYEDLFGDYKHPQDMPISDLITPDRLEDFRFMIQKQGKYGRATVNKFKRIMKAGKALPPVVAWYNSRTNGQHIIGGRHRIIAAVEIGLTHVPTILMYWRDRED